MWCEDNVQGTWNNFELLKFMHHAYFLITSRRYFEDNFSNRTSIQKGPNVPIYI